MKVLSARRAFVIILCLVLSIPGLESSALAEVSPGFTEMKVNSEAPRPADQINPAIDGNRIVWQDNRTRDWNIFMKDLVSGTESQILASATTQQYPAISGDKVVWSQWREAPSPNPWSRLFYSNIYMKDLTGGQVTQLSESASTQQYPAISGNKVVWQDDRNGNDEIYVFDIDTKSETRLTANIDAQRNPAISGNRVVWADWRNSSIDVYVNDLSTGAEQRISLNVADQSMPDISGDKIVWQDSRDNSIYLYNLSNSTEQRIPTQMGYYLRSNPSISGNIVVWQEFRDGNWDIYMYNISSGVQTRVTNNSGDQIHPVVSGNRVAWQDDRNANWDIYVYDIGTGAETQVNSNASFIPADQQNPAVDGSRIVWQDDRDGYPHIYLKDLGTGSERRLSESAATQQYPAISGDNVVWQDSRDGGSIYMYNISTSSETRLSGATLQYAPPANPRIDGSKIVWEDYRDNWYSSVYMYDLSSSSEKRIAGGTLWYDRALQPDVSANKVVWLQNPYPYWYWYWYPPELRLRNLSTGEESLVSQAWDLSNPAISGNTVVWQRGYYSEYYWPGGYSWWGDADIYMKDILTGMETRLTTNEYAQIKPEVSDSKIVWADRRWEGYWYAPFYGVFLYDTATSVDTRLTTSPSPQDNPDVSGNLVVWQDYRNENWDIYMIDLNNRAPSANAGPDQTVNEGAVVSLSGSGTDPNGDTITYGWSQAAGPGVSLAGANTLTPSFVAPSVDNDATLTFELTVADGKGGAAADSVNILVKNVPPAPPSPPPSSAPPAPAGGGPAPDTALPSILLISPGPGWTLTQTIDVIAVAADNVGIDRVEFYINDSLRSVDTTAPYTYAWNTTVDANGPYTISAIAFDGAGNVSAASLSVTAANAAPATAGVYYVASEQVAQPHLAYQVVGGAFRSVRSARRRVGLLRRRGFRAQVLVQGGRRPYLVEIGVYDDRATAQGLLRRLRRRRLKFARILEILR